MARVVPIDQFYEVGKKEYWYFLKGHAMWRFYTKTPIDKKRKLSGNYYHNEIDCLVDKGIVYAKITIKDGRKRTRYYTKDNKPFKK